MHMFNKGTLIRAGVLALGLSMAGTGAAYAGVWRVDPNKCPDLREDRWDRREDHGWADRREDRRDERVINCPARAWYYVPSRGERRNHYTTPRPRAVYFSEGRHYYRDRNGVEIFLRLG